MIRKRRDLAPRPEPPGGVIDKKGFLWTWDHMKENAEAQMRRYDGLPKSGRDIIKNMNAPNIAFKSKLKPPQKA